MIRRVAIFGAGTMGGGIAITCIKARIPVTVIDTTEATLERLQARVEKHLLRELEKARMSPDEAEEAREHLTLAIHPEACATADLVIEAVFEDLAVKQSLMRRIERSLAPGAIIATNTSCLLVRDIARVLDRPGRLLGLHYFSPAEIAPTVEVISTPETRTNVMMAAMEFLRVTGKSPLPCRDSPGFALNRFFCPYCNEAVRLLDEGVGSTGQIDAVACETLDVAAGPFRVMNLTKPQIMMKAVESLAALGPSYRIAPGLAEIGASGADWRIEAEPEALDPAARTRIADRLAGAALLPAIEALNEGVVAAEDLERGAREALRFVRNPVELRQHLPPQEIARLIACVAA